MKPTDEQIKEFWEWCGFVDTFEGDTGAYYWTAPNDGGYGVDLPPIDLNNLFRWAVPKLQDKGYMVELYAFECKDFRVRIYNVTYSAPESWRDPIVEVKNEDPALSLFWAIYEVINAKEAH